MIKSVKAKCKVVGIDGDEELIMDVQADMPEAPELANFNKRQQDQVKAQFEDAKLDVVRTACINALPEGKTLHSLIDYV
jgi:hypothetical protein